MDKRFRQANKEAILSISLTICYLLCWIVCSYYLGETAGIFGFPAWFEASCIFTTVGFILLCYLIVKKMFKNIPLDEPSTSSHD